MAKSTRARYWAFAVDKGVAVVNEQSALHDFFVGATRACAAAVPEDVVITFDIEDRGSWTLVNGGGGVSVRRRPHHRPDCRVMCDGPTLRALLDGRLHYRRAFFEGLVRVEGDVGLVLNLLRALGST